MKLEKAFMIMAVLFAITLAGTGFAAAAEDTRTFTDDFGREVTLPATVDTILPSGPLALSVLISFDPDYLASCGNGLPATAGKYLPKLYAKNLPKTGSLLTSTNTVNYEEVMSLHKQGVDAYVDVGQAKAGVVEALNEFTNTTGMASIFVSQNTLQEIPESYKKLGEILGDTKRSNELYTYMKGWIDIITEGMKKVESSGKKLSAAQITSIDGNNVCLLGGYNDDHSYGYAGTDINTLTNNVVTAKSTKGHGDSYSMEEVLKNLSEANPDVIFVNGAENHTYYNAVMSNPVFSGLSAIKNGKVYEIPADCPYIWTAQPFSGWGICGMIWMANILYPDVFTYNVKDKIQEFYKVMIGYDLSDAEYANITEHSPSTATPAPVFGSIAALAAAGIFALHRKP